MANEDTKFADRQKMQINLSLCNYKTRNQKQILFLENRAKIRTERIYGYWNFTFFFQKRASGMTWVILF